MSNTKKSLKTLIDEAPYSTDLIKQRAAIVATFLMYLQTDEDFKYKSVVTKDDEGGETYMFYTSNGKFEYYLWVDIYEEGELIYSSLEDCLLEEILYSSDDSQMCFFNLFKAIDERGGFKNADIKEYLCG